MSPLADFLPMTVAMSQIIDLFSSLLFPCLHCGSLQCQKPPLCTQCSQQLVRYEGAPLHQYDEGLFQAYSQYEWSPGQSDIFSSMVLSLKGKYSRRYWARLAAEFVQKRLSLEMQNRPIKIVPAPSSSGKKDHAFWWGETLARELKADFVPCLQKATKRSQRGQSRQQRSKLRISVDEKYSDQIDSSSEALWVFVDDILTTGATAHAAYEALGSPPHFEVWVLGYRSLSCGVSRDLL